MILSISPGYAGTEDYPMSEANDHETLSQLSPEVERARLPRHYTSSDIPHVLAHVRFMDEFCSAVDERADASEGKYDEILRLYIQMASGVLAPYALELARSLISLEDTCQPSSTSGDVATD
jgi:hypothetical protein